jgi:uncharacterized membrane protein YozB (DUF420 family)
MAKGLGIAFNDMLPLFIITVCIVFSFVFTVLTVPLGPITSDINVIFILMLVVTTTVASVVSVIFYMTMINRREARAVRRYRRRRR